MLCLHGLSSEFNLEDLSEKEQITVDILLAAVNYVGVGMVSLEVFLQLQPCALSH